MAVANAHDVDLRKVVQDKILVQMVKHVTQCTRGWVIMVVDDETTRALSHAVRMSDLTDCGVSLLERLELERQPFPEMNVVYFIAPTAANLRRVARDFQDANKPKYNDVYLYFLHHAGEDALAELKDAPPALLQRLKALQEVNVDFLALEKCAFSFGMPSAFHTLYSPVVKKDESDQLLQQISSKLVSVCATLEEYPYVRFQAGHQRMETLAQLFQTKMNEFLAQNDTFVYAPKRGTLLFVDRGQDMVTPFMHESTFQAMTYDLLDVKDEQISYPAETNAGTVTKTAFLNDNDTLWVEFHHTHIAQVSTEIGKRMTALAASNAGSSLGRGKSTDLHAMAAALRELPEYREMLGKLSQHLFLAGKAMEIFTATCLLDASNIEQSLATGVDASGKKLKHSSIVKQLEDLFKEPKLTENDRFRVAAVFALTQDSLKDVDRSKVLQAATLSKQHDIALENMHLVGGAALYKQNGLSSIPSEELKAATKKAEAVEYSNARYDPKLKAMVTKALKSTLSESEYPFIIAPPLKSPKASDEASKKAGPISLRKCEAEGFSGEKMIVFVCGGASYSEVVLFSPLRAILRGVASFTCVGMHVQLRSMYEVRAEEKRDVILGSTSFLTAQTFIDSLATLKEASPTLPSPPSRPKGSGSAHSFPPSSDETKLKMVRALRWALVLTAAFAASAYAKEPAQDVAADPVAAVEEDAECMEPAILEVFETKIAELEQANEALLLKVDAQATAFAEDQSKLLAGVAKEHETIVLKLQEEISSLSGDVSILEKDVEKERAALAQAETEVAVALAKLSEELARVAALEKTVTQTEKRNKALRKELDASKSVELTLAALLSSYYDESLLLAELAAIFAGEQFTDSSGTLTHVQQTLAEAKKTVGAATDKFYTENLAATLDPIVADVHKAVDPHVAKYLPIVQGEAAKAKEQVVQMSQTALHRAKAVRLEAIALLEQNEHVAPHAQKVIDGVLLLLAVPLVLLQIRLLLRLAWWLFTTAVCVLTCGLCCRGRKRSAKLKRKAAKKASSSSSSPVAIATAKKSTTTKMTTASATSQKRNKKSKN
ncbi:hypothetical protein BBJ28_00011523 [Nothophytophthora sp. Chile5]|nr:hypothetical protein BBJ28_00011523 [Nothophytophthora sp. Chile5]